MRAYTDAEIQAAEEIFAEFLAAMPELGIHKDFPAEQKIVDECYGGKPGAYIWETFGSFLDQCIDEVGEDQLAHRGTSGFCAKCGGECHYDDDGNPK
jgi:hypothetical protein